MYCTGYYSQEDIVQNTRVHQHCSSLTSTERSHIEENTDKVAWAQHRAATDLIKRSHFSLASIYQFYCLPSPPPPFPLSCFPGSVV